MSEEVELTGFLEGGRLRLSWNEVALSEGMSAAEWRSIECFQTRAREFLLDVGDLKLPNVQHLSLARDTPRMRVTVEGYPGRHRAKGLFADFRHLLAEKEPGTFRRVRNIVRRRTDDLALCRFLDGLNEQFLPKQDSSIDFMRASFTIEHLLKLWFSTEFFHSGDVRQLEARRLMLEKLEAAGAAQLLFWTVVRVAHPVKALYACVKDIRRDGPLVVRCPDARLLNRRTVGQPEGT